MGRKAESLPQIVHPVLPKGRITNALPSTLVYGSNQSKAILTSFLDQSQTLTYSHFLIQSLLSLLTPKSKALLIITIKSNHYLPLLILNVKLSSSVWLRVYLNSSQKCHNSAFDDFTSKEGKSGNHYTVPLTLAWPWTVFSLEQPRSSTRGTSASLLSC